MHRPLLLKTLVCLVVLALMVSAIDPHDRTTWLLEVLPVAILLPALVYNHHRFPLSSLLYLLLAVQALGLVAGGHYTFARVMPPAPMNCNPGLPLPCTQYLRGQAFLHGLAQPLHETTLQHVLVAADETRRLQGHEGRARLR